MKNKFESSDWMTRLPIPVCEEHPEYEDFYFKTWELAHGHIKHIPGMPQTPYMDEGFCDTQIWIWDTCFMAQFCKYAGDDFPGVESFRNFYEVLYGNSSLPRIMTCENEPSWACETPGKESNVFIHIADNPPLFAWGEYENALLSGDREYIKDLLYNKAYLQKHYDWFEGLRFATQLPGVFAETRLVAERDGYRWEGGRSGMDNTPRGRRQVGDPKRRPNDPDLLWIDALCQQALAADMISRLYSLVEDKASAKLWAERYDEKKRLLNLYYWDEEDGFYYDIDAGTHEHRKVMTVASYWALTARLATPERAAAMAARLTDPMTFGGEPPLVSLARFDGDYYPDGRYWRGGLWLPTAYAALKGLASYGYHKEVQQAAHKIFDHMLKTYECFEPHTVWECYSPERSAPALDAKGEEYVRADFCGWSALGPISVYIECVLGFHTVNAFTNTVEWELPDCFYGEIGIKNLRFGETVTDITARCGICKVVSNKPYTLLIGGRPYYVQQGANEFKL